MKNRSLSGALLALVFTLAWGQAAIADDGADLAREARSLLSTVHISVTFRANLLRVKDRLDTREALTINDHTYIERSAALFLRLDERLETAQHRYESAVSEAPGADRARRLVLYAAALKTRYENAGAMVRLAENGLAEARYDQVEVTEGFIRSVRARFADPKTAAALLELEDALAGAQSDLGQATRGDAFAELLDAAVEAPSLEPVEGGMLAEGMRWATAKAQNAGLLLGEMVNDVAYGASKLFGNAAGSIRFLGMPKISGKNKAEVVAQIEKLLQPGDIMLDKTAFALTDRIIPGYFGHVAVWIGHPDEVTAEHLFEAQYNPYLGADAAHWEERAMAGAGVLEALRPGVTLNTVDHFCHLDDVVVMRIRPKFLDERSRIKDVRHGLKWLGTAYDFNFDVNTDDRIVCSELVYQIFPIDWPTSASVGRRSISPDQVASQCGPTGDFPLELVYWARGTDRFSGDDEGYRTFWQSLVGEGVALPEGARGDAIRALGVEASE